MMTLLHRNTCSKSRCALGLLQDSGQAFTVRDYVAQPLSVAELKHLFRLLDQKPFALIRKGEAVYKEQFKGKDLSDEEWIAVLAAHPILLERPILIDEDTDTAIVGRPPELIEAYLQQK